MENVSTILPTLITGTNDLVTRMKNDPRTNSKVTGLLNKASKAISSVNQIGLKDSITKAVTILQTLPIDVNHPMAQHADVAKCGLEFAQKYLELDAKK